MLKFPVQIQRISVKHIRKFVLLLSLVMTYGVTAFDYKAKEYTYLIRSMPKIDSGLLKLHFGLYEGYVNQVNRLNHLLEEALTSKGGVDAFRFESIKRQFGWEYDGMVLHEYYFDNLGGRGRIPKNSVIYKRIQDRWGSFEKWRDEFTRTCKQRGIGWTILYYNQEKDLLYNAWVTDHATGPLIGATPLLVVDLWEHAYLCQFGTDREKYVNTIFEYIDWDVVNRRFKGVSQTVKRASRSQDAPTAAQPTKEVEK